MNIRRSFVTRLCLFAALALSACDPTAGQSARITDADLETGRARIAVNQALVIAVSGDVRVSTGDSAQPVDTGNAFVSENAGYRTAAVGDLLLGTQTVRTGKNSSCDLQFGNAAVIRVEDQAELKLETINIRPNETDVELRALSGTVLYRVANLAKSERFRVRTATAVCGVRGTEFAVSVGGESGTVLAVKAGTVAFLATGTDVDQLQGKASRTDTALAEALGGMEAGTMLVGAYGQASATAAQARSTDEVLKRISALLEKLSGQMTISGDEKIEFGEAVKKAGAEIRLNTTVAEALDADQKAKVDRIQGLQAVPLTIQLGYGGVDAEAAAVPNEKLVRIFVKASPPDAAIFKDGEMLGRGIFNAILPAGRKIDLLFSAPEHHDRALSIVPDPAGKKSYEVILEKTEKTTAAPDAASRNILDPNETVFLWESFENEHSWKTGREIWGPQGGGDSAREAKTSPNFAMPGAQSLEGTFWMDGYNYAFFGTDNIDQDLTVYKALLVAVKNFSDKDLVVHLTFQFGEPDWAWYQVDGDTVKAGRSGILRFNFADFTLRSEELRNRYPTELTDLAAVKRILISFAGEAGANGKLYIDGVKLVKK